MNKKEELKLKIEILEDINKILTFNFASLSPVIDSQKLNNIIQQYKTELNS